MTHAELRRLAEAATPGPWTFEHVGMPGGLPAIFNADGHVIADLCGRLRMENAAYIAAAHPKTVLWDSW